MGCEACLRLLSVTSVGNRIPDLLISGPLPYQLVPRALKRKEVTSDKCNTLIECVIFHKNHHTKNLEALGDSILHSDVLVTP